jgi:hypothetical protein
MFCISEIKNWNGQYTGSWSQGTIATHSLPSTCLDEGFTLQCFDRVPQARAWGWVPLMFRGVLRFWPGITQGQSCLQNQNLAVELLAGPSQGQPRIGGLLVTKTEKMDQQTVQIWILLSHLGYPAGLDACSWINMTRMTCIYNESP